MMTGLYAVSIARALFHAALLFVINPWLYIGLALTIWELSRNAKWERKFFGIRTTRISPPFIRRTIAGVVLGLIASAVFLLAGAVVTQTEVWVVTILSVILLVLRVRLAFLPYAIALLAAFHAVCLWIPTLGLPLLVNAEQFLRSFHAASWLSVAAVLLVLQGILLWMQRKDTAVPTVVVSKRGAALGGFVVQVAFCSALVLPVHAAGGLSVQFAWPTLVNMGAISLIGLPAFSGISMLVLTERPRERIQSVGTLYVVMGLITAGLVWVVLRVPTVGGLAAAFAVVLLLEVAVRWLLRRERMGDKLFIEAADGVRILATAPNAAGADMGLQPGEIVTHVNQIPTHSAYDLHFAFDQNPAYAKLQVVDRRGEIRFVSSPVFDGQRYQLGIVFVPETRERFGCDWIAPGLWQSLYLRVSGEDSLNDWSMQTAAPIES